MKKIICILTIFMLTITISMKTFADEETEEINEQELKEYIIQASTEQMKQPNINSRAVLILDRGSNTVIYEKNGYTKRAMASTTKIMTATVVLENSNLTDTVEISKKAAGTGGSRLGLKTGDKVSVNDLLYGLMLRSGNDAAVALAEHVGGSVEQFAEMMNKKAKQLNLQNTHFVTPHGLDKDEHYTTAYELAKLASYALNNKKFATIVNTKQCNIYINGQIKTISNTNELLGNLYGVDGVKTGFTNNAGRCIVTSTTRNGNQIICVVLGADTKKIRTQDSVKLIEYAFSNFEYVQIKKQIQEEFAKWEEKFIQELNIVKGGEQQPKLELEELEYETMPIQKEQIKDIKVQIQAKQQLMAPVEQNTQIGILEVKIKEQTTIKLNIKMSQQIQKKTVMDYMNELIKKHLPNLLINSQSWSII